MLQVLKKDHSAMVSTISAVIGLISLILFAVLSTDGANDSICLVVYVTLLAGIVLQVVSILGRGKLKGSPMVLTVIGFAQTACYAVSLAIFIIGRVSWLFMLLSKMSSIPLTALFPTTIVFFAVTIIVQVISTFLTYEE